MNRSDSNPSLFLSKKKSNIIVFTDPEEEKLIEEITTTPYEKVVKILNNLKSQLEDINFDKDSVADLQWVIKKIQSHTLYTYDLTDQSLSSSNNEVNSLVEYLHDFSEIREIQRRNRDAKSSKTSITRDPRKIRSIFSRRSQTLTFNKLDDLKELIFNDHKKEEDLFDLKIINETNFDIFKFEELVGNKNVLPFIAKFSYQTTGTIEMLNNEVLDKFLERCRDGYNDVPYHNSLHGADVCQTILTILSQTNVVEVLHLSQADVISMLTAALLHDIGHPGTNNTYQINSSSDFAVSYNDKSVLENFHAAEGFRIMLKPESNILSKLDFMTYRHIRKRMIEQILATDMMFHAKTLSIVKNKLINYDISAGNNMEKIFQDSSNIFDEQQEILNFMIHTCDIGHSAKSFEISKKWTYKIMNEFWTQGDLEKKKGIPVSFLCDRDKAEVPKNQVVFLKSILVPDYEILIDMFPTLSHFKVNLEDNVNKWMLIAEEEREKQNK